MAIYISVHVWASVRLTGMAKCLTTDAKESSFYPVQFYLSTAYKSEKNTQLTHFVHISDLNLSTVTISATVGPRGKSDLGGLFNRTYNI